MQDSTQPVLSECCSDQPAANLALLAVRGYYQLAVKAAARLVAEKQTSAIRAARTSLLDHLQKSAHPENVWIAVVLCVLGYTQDGLAYLFRWANRAWNEDDRSLADRAYRLLAGHMEVAAIAGAVIARLRWPDVTLDGQTNFGYILGTSGCTGLNYEEISPATRAGYLHGLRAIAYVDAGKLALQWVQERDIPVKLAAIRTLGIVRPAGAYEALQQVRGEFNAIYEKTETDWAVLKAVDGAVASLFGDQEASFPEDE